MASNIKENSLHGGTRAMETSVMNNKKLTNAKIIDCVKCLHDAVYYSSLGLRVNIECDYLSKYLNFKTLRDVFNILIVFIQKLSKRRLINLIHKFKQLFNTKLSKYMKRIRKMIKETMKNERINKLQIIKYNLIIPNIIVNENITKKIIKKIIINVDYINYINYNGYDYIEEYIKPNELQIVKYNNSISSVIRNNWIKEYKKYIVNQEIKELNDIEMNTILDENNKENIYIQKLDVNATLLIGGATYKSKDIIRSKIRANYVGFDTSDIEYANQLSDRDVSREEIIRLVGERIRARRRRVAEEKEREEKLQEMNEAERIRERKRRLTEELLNQFRTNIAQQNFVESYSQIVGYSKRRKNKNAIIRSYVFNVPRPRLRDLNNLTVFIRDYLNQIRTIVTSAIGNEAYSHVQINPGYSEYGYRNIHVSSSWNDSIMDFMDSYLNIIEKYGDDNVDLNKIKVNVYLVNRFIGAGSENKSIILDQEKYYIIDPVTKTNCMYVAVVIALNWKENNKLLYDKKVQQKNGANLKQRATCEHTQYSDEDDIELVANYKQVTIEVYDYAFELIQTIGNYETSVKIILDNNHFKAMIDKDELRMTGLKIDMKPKPKIVNTAIEPMELKYKPKRMVSYDIETYKLNIEDKSYDSIPYAIGWCFEIEEKDKTLDEFKSYEIIEYTMNDKVMIIAYKSEIGEDCINKFIDALKIQYLSDCVCYAHNGGKFDLHVIYKYSNLLSRDDLEIDGRNAIVLNSRMIQLNAEFKDKYISIPMKNNKPGSKTRYRKKRYTISFRDSYPIFQGKLADMCKDLKVPHQKLEEKIKIHKLINKDNWRSMYDEHDIGTYLKHDVLGLYECLCIQNISIKEKVGIHISQIVTAASLAKKYFYGTKYNPTCNKETLYELDLQQEEFLRKTYNGGRVENFVSKEIEGPIYYYDFTSLYPWAYLGKLPSCVAKWVCDPNKPLNKEYVNAVFNRRIYKEGIDNKCYFWQIKVRSPSASTGNPQNQKPLLGFKEDSKFLFQWYKDGTEMYVPEPEIIAAVRIYHLDYEFEPINALWLEACDLLASSAKELFEDKANAKSEGKPAKEKQSKIIINSLYGLFGLNKIDRESIEICSPSKSSWAMALVQNKLINVEEVGNHIITRRLKDLESNRTNVAISSWVSSQARLKLYEAMHLVESKGGKVLYCDTDSMITNYCIENDPELCEKLMGKERGEKLGQLKNECVDKYNKYLKKNPNSNIKVQFGFKRGVIVNPKCYYLEPYDKEIPAAKACKGWTEDEDEPSTILTYDKYCEILYGGATIPCTQFLASNHRLMLGGGVVIKEITKTFKQQTNKGELQENGDILPFIKSSIDNESISAEEIINILDELYISRHGLT